MLAETKSGIDLPIHVPAGFSVEQVVGSNQVPYASDETFTGLIPSQTADMMVIKTAGNTGMRIPRQTIRSVTPGTISIMSEGLDMALIKTGLLDLPAFLQAQNGNEFLEAAKH